MASDTAADPAAPISAQVRAEIDALDRELAEIEMLVGQARAEAARHEQKRATAAEKLAGAGPNANPADLVDGYGTLVTLTRRAVLMEAQVDVLEGKRKALARHRAALASLADRLEGVTVPDAAAVAPADEAPPALSRVVLSAQEDLRREIARAMHDGPAQSLTNIVLQAQIVDRLLERDPGHGQGRAAACWCRWSSRRWTPPRPSSSTSGRWCSTTWAWCPRSGAPRVTGAAARRSPPSSSRWARTGACRWTWRAPSSGSWTRPSPRTSRWARSGCSSGWTGATSWRPTCPRTGPRWQTGDAPLPEVPTGDVPDAIKQMIQDRHDARDAAVVAAEQAAIVVLPAAARRDAQERAGSIGARVEIGGGGSELLLVVPLPPADEEDGQPA